MARIDPPAEVQAAISTALRACHAWRPVAVNPPRTDAPHASALRLPPMTVEAAICNTIDDWPHNADVNDYAWLSEGVVLGLLAAFVLLVVRRLVRAFGRTTAGFWLRDKLGGPWRVVVTAAPGALLGALLGGLVSTLLWNVGLRSAVATQVLCVLGGVGGAYGIVWLRRWERQHEEPL